MLKAECRIPEDVISLEIRFGHTRVPVLLGTGARFEQTATEAIRDGVEEAGVALALALVVDDDR